MLKRNQNGSAASILIIAVLAVLLIGSLGFAAWAYAGRQDYKNNSDAKAAAAVVVAKAAEDKLKDAAAAEAAKSPIRFYNGPQAYGSIVVGFPKTWSGYVDDSGNSGSPIDGYFSPSVVPSITDQSSVFALRVQVLGEGYSQALQENTNPQFDQSVKPFAFPKVPNTVGVEITGQLANSKTGTMVILPLRDKTLEVYTEGTQYVNDFNTYIIPNFTFSP